MPKFERGDEIVLVHSFSYFDRLDVPDLEEWLDTFMPVGARGYVLWAEYGNVSVQWDNQVNYGGEIPEDFIEHYRQPVNQPSMYQQKLF